jgi:dGTPase
VLVPPDWRAVSSRTEQLRTFGDVIAGMTDRFAIARHEELVGPVELPAGRF